MNETLKKVLDGKADNHVLPFFWQHGEDEATLREMMGAIHGAGCEAVCVESRPHPDFCGDKWWADMDVILDEARTRNMKVWILDDSHFPTGFANNALKGKPDSLCRQNLFSKEKVYRGKEKTLSIDLAKGGFLKKARRKGLMWFPYLLSFVPLQRRFADDAILCVTARKEDHIEDITDCVTDGILHWEKPDGEWILSVITKSRNTGYHQTYINMTEEDSCQVLIDAVYEPHWQHYKNDFGKTIAGFFSDEPELGNGIMYVTDNYLGTEQDLPWGPTMESQVAEALGKDWRKKLHLLWREGTKAQQVRSRYMDVLTKRVRDAFSKTVAQWCADHGVQYIGHLIEDNGQHTRTGSSLGHYFRGLQYQDMAGIDDIGGQVFPQGEVEPVKWLAGLPRNGEFYHYGLAKLAHSAAAIEHRKNGNAMCEIFGNYGWGEGVHLEKYLADHFLVRGINQFVPHAFSGLPFPDQDCPPHFYAHGHNPQYRHFGELIRYMNRVATLTSSGKHRIPVAILYHAEAEWATSADAMPFEVPLHALYDHQIDCHTIPADVFTETEHYRTSVGEKLCINGQVYEALVIPSWNVLPQAAVAGISQLMNNGFPVVFVDRIPETVAETGEHLPEQFSKACCVALNGLPAYLREIITAPELKPASDRIRILHIIGKEDMFFLVNESDKKYRGKIQLPADGLCYLYDPWHNHCMAADRSDSFIIVELDPLKSIFVVFGTPSDLVAQLDYAAEGIKLLKWNRSLCEGSKYPDFGQKNEIILPDKLAEEEPKFSGFVRYETTVMLEKEKKALLEISNASEGVEVFVNGISLGIQIAPPYQYDLCGAIRSGENHIAIEVATTLHRQAYPLQKGRNRLLYAKPTGESGLNGIVKLIAE